MVSVDSMLNWNEHDVENKTKEAEQVYGLMDGFELDFAVPGGNAVGGVNPAAVEFAMMGNSPKVQTCPFGCDFKLSKLKHNYDHLEKLYNDSFIQVQAYKNTVKTLEHQKGWYHTTQLALEEKVRILSANLENTNNTLKYFETLYDQPKLEKKEWEVKFVESLARFDKWKESSKHLTKLLYSSMSTKTKLSLGFKEYIGSDEVCDLSTPSVFDPEPDNREVKSLYESPKTNDSFSTVDVKLLPKFDVKDLSFTNDLPSCSFKENVKPPRNLCNKSEIANRIPCKNTFVRTKKCFVCGCKSHLIKDCNVHDTVDNFPFVVTKAASLSAASRNSSASISAGRYIPAGSRNRSAFIYAGRSIPATSRNRSASIHVGRSIPAASRNTPASIHAGKHIPAGRINKPAPFPAGSSVPTDIDIVDSGCSRSMTGNKEMLDDFVQVKGDTITFGGRDGKITGRGHHCFNRKQLNKKVKAIRCDNEIEFRNAKLIALCGEKGIKRDYSNAKTPQQNGVVERKNRTLIEAARSMLADSKLPTMFWTEAVSTACYVLNRVSITNPYNKTPYELLSGKVPNIQHLKPFGCQVTILKTSDHLGKFKGKANDDFLVGYVSHSKAYRVYNLSNKKVKEMLNLRYLEDKPNVQGLGQEWYFDLDYLTDSLGYTRFKTNPPAGTHDTNILAGTQADDSDSEYDEQGILVPSFPSNSFSEELAGLQRQEYEAYSAAAKHGFEFLVDTAALLPQAEIEIRRNLVPVTGVLAGSIVSTSSVPTSGVPAGSLLASRVPDGSLPASSIPAGGVPTGSIDYAEFGVPAASDSVPAVLSNDLAATSLLPPGHSLGSCKHTTRFPSLSDLGNHQPTAGIFSSSSYDDDFCADVTNLALNVVVDPVATKRVNTIRPQSQIIRALQSPVQTRSIVQKSNFGKSTFISYVHNQIRTNHADHLHCLFACFLSQLEPSSVAKALEDPDWIAIGTKWILKNKRDARGIVVQNKARLVAQGHRQEEGIDYDEIFAPVAKIEVIRLFLAFASYMGFMVYQMDVKSAFLYGEIDEEVYVTQPKGFEDPYNLKHVYRVVKALYGLHQAPRACQDKYVKDMLKKFDMESMRTATTPYEVPKHKSKDDPDDAVNVHLFRSMIGSLMHLTASGPDIIDCDYAGSHGDRKSTTGGCQFLGRRLISWQCKKQTVVATSSTKVEYVAAASCCGQSTIYILKNPVFHQRTKHIEIRHHFIRDAYEKHLIQVLLLVVLVYADDLVPAGGYTLPAGSYSFILLNWFLLVVVPIPTGSYFSCWSLLGFVHAYHDMAGHTKHFTTLRKLLYMVEKTDLQKLLGAVDEIYQKEEPDTFALLLWGDLHVLFQSLNDADALDFWCYQDSWHIRSWRLYPRAQVYVLETVDGRIIHMFVDVSYPLTGATLECMLKHRLEVPKLLVGGDLTMAEQLISFIKAALLNAKSAVSRVGFSTTPQMVFSSPWLTAEKELTHHEGTALMLLFHDPAVFGVPADLFCWSLYFCWFWLLLLLVAAGLVCSCCWNKRCNHRAYK
nr:ribonuclease H-like domain-containing protein [Tanacetum cinerariifolium]